MESILIICGNYFRELSFDYNKGVAKTKFSLTTPNHQNSNTCVVMSLRSVSQSFDSVIRGHHIYKEVWSPVIGEILTCEEEPGNVNDLFAVAIKRSGIVVGHIPRTISSVCCLFLRRGTISCEVIGHRQYSLDLPQGGLDVPCRLTFTGIQEDIEKVKKLLEKAPIEKALKAKGDTEIPVKVSCPPTEDCEDEPNSKRSKIDLSVSEAESSKTKLYGDDHESESSSWITIELPVGLAVLSTLDKAILLNGSCLNDKHISAAQLLLLHQFQATVGLQNTLSLDKIAAHKKITHGLQIIHDRKNHWIVASNFTRKDNVVEIHDSIYKTVNMKTRTLVSNLFQPYPGKRPVVQIVNKKQKQTGNKDCGLFAIATATAMLFGHNAATVYFNQKLMREHLARCFEGQHVTPFPEEIV